MHDDVSPSVQAFSFFLFISSCLTLWPRGSYRMDCGQIRVLSKTYVFCEAVRAHTLNTALSDAIPLRNEFDVVHSSLFLFLGCHASPPRG